MQSWSRLSLAMGAAALMPATAAAFDLEVDIHGFVSQGYVLTTENNTIPSSNDGSWEFNEIGLNIGSQLTDNLRVGIQLFSRDFGQFGNNKVELDWAYGDYSHNEYIGVRAGRFKTPVGLYNEYVDIDAARTFVFYPDAVYSNAFRDVSVATNGVNVYGNIPIMEDFGSIDYDLFSGDLRLDEDGSLGEIFGSIMIIDKVDIKYLHGIRAFYNTPLEGLRVGGSFLYYDDLLLTGRSSAAFDTSSLHIHVPTAATPPTAVDPTATSTADFHFDLYQYLLSVEYTWETWTFAAEYSRMRGDGVLRPNIGSALIPNINSRVEREGWYIAVGKQINDQWSAGAYYSEFYPDASDRDGSNNATATPPSEDHRAWQKIFAGAVKWDINDYWSLKAEGQHVTGTANLFTTLNPQGLEEDYQVLYLKTTFSF